jgi:hypothetical protein
MRFLGGKWQKKNSHANNGNRMSCLADGVDLDSGEVKGNGVRWKRFVIPRIRPLVRKAEKKGSGLVWYLRGLGG